MSFTLQQIRYHKWRHNERGYTVNVLGVYSHGFPICSQTVHVDKHNVYSDRSRRWDINQFLCNFTPLGEPYTERTIWDHLED